MKKKFVLVPTAAIAVLLAFATVAWACTSWKGTFDVKGNRSDSGTVQSKGGNCLLGGMCQTVTSPVAKADSSNGSFTIATGAYSCGVLCTSKLPAGTYDVNFYNSQGAAGGYASHSNWETDCMSPVPSPPTGFTTWAAAVTVNSSGVASPKSPYTSLTYTLPNSLSADSSPQESAVCISDSNANYGNQAPLTII